MTLRITRNRLIIVGALVLAVGGWLLLDWLIVTDRERVQHTLDGLAVAVEKNNPDAIMPFLDADFRIAGMNALEFRDWYGEILQAIRVKKLTQWQSTVEIDKHDPDTAIATVQAIVLLDRTKDESRVDWWLQLRRHNGTEWKLVTVRAFWPLNGAEIPLRAVKALIGL